jgi:sulfite exporter TauE/SafE/copper chaperone CopZ
MKKIIYIQGMHCRSCEKLLENEIGNIKGVENVKADSRNGTAEIDYDRVPPNFANIKKTARKFGYDAFEYNPNPPLLKPKKNNLALWAKSLIIIGIIFLFYNIIRDMGVLDGLNIKDAKITYGISFLIGLVASVSSCLAVVGAVIIAFGEKYKTEGHSFFEKAIRPNLFFHIGRLATFFVLGGILGLIGGEINISGSFISIFTIIIAAVMFWLGLNILGILPSITRLGISMPKKLSEKWDNLKKSEHKAAPFLLGGLSFFLPCGFTQSMQIFALASGSFLVGGITLFIFALGTVPSLLAIGITTSWTKGKKMELFQKVAGFLVLIFAIYTFQSGLSLSGVKTNVLTTKKEEAVSNKNLSQNNEALADSQIVRMEITARGFEPNIIKIKKGIPVKWIINGDKVTSCTNKIIVPKYNISQNISYGENIINFIPTESGEIPFSCWMGMVRGKFIVE